MKSKICTPREYESMCREGKYLFHAVQTFFMQRGGVTFTRMLLAYEEI